MEESEIVDDLQEKPKQDEQDSICQTKQYVPQHLIGLMYRLDLSLLFFVRKFLYENKYPLLKLEFGSSKTDKFSNIIIKYKKKSIHIHIENVDNYSYIDNSITYDRLFNRLQRRQSFFINDFFDSFVKHLISKSDGSINKIKYLIVYTNSVLDLTEAKTLKNCRSSNFYPFEFDKINIEECDILKDFLLTNNNEKGCIFYKFSQEDRTREELLKRLELPHTMQDIIEEKNLSIKGIKEKFLDKLIFAVNQPDRENLNMIIKNDIQKNDQVQIDYAVLQKRLLRYLTDLENRKKYGNYISEIIYEFNLFKVLLQDMFVHKYILSINLEGKGNDISSGIIINYKGRASYLKAYNADYNIGYSKLFPSDRKKCNFSINKHFAIFATELKTDIRYFIIYTNANLDLTEENKLKKSQSKSFYAFKFESLDIRKRKYKVLRNCSCINEVGLYKFSQEDSTKLISLLELPPSLKKDKKEGRLCDESEREIKEKFLGKLIFAINQPNMKKLNSIIKNESNKVPFNYEELHEIALRWSESHAFGPITKGVMEKLLGDIQNNRRSNQKIQNKNINDAIKFAKSVFGREGTLPYDNFLNFLVMGQGKFFYDAMKRKGVDLASVSAILTHAGTNAREAFKELYGLWFDEKGNRTHYLRTLEKQKLSLCTMTSILNGAGTNAARVFQDLYSMWFDLEGNKTQYIRALEDGGIKLANISSILHGARTNAAKAFHDLYNILFDVEGNKKQYLRTLDDAGIRLSIMSSILGGAGINAAKAFEDLYSIWFDVEGNKTQYLRSLENEGIKLATVSSILGGAGVNAAGAFKDLYAMWFDDEGNKTPFLRTLENEGIKLVSVSTILHGAGMNAAKAFQDLYSMWFDVKGNKTQYLKSLESEGIKLANMASILNGAGTFAAEAFKDLYAMWFDVKGNETQYLKVLKDNGIKPIDVTVILNGAGINAGRSFKDLCDMLFDAQGNKSQYLRSLEDEGIKLANVTNILDRVGANAARAFEELCTMWFDVKGNKTQHLKILEEEGMNLVSMSSILKGAGLKASKVFEELYYLWFDDKGNKKPNLKTLENEEVNLCSMCNILKGAGVKAPKVFEELYFLWFDAEGNKKPYLKTLENEGDTLASMCNILKGAGVKAPGAFKELYNLWFDLEGNKKQYLKSLEKEDVNLVNITSILNGAGANAPKAFVHLYNIWFDKQGNNTQYLKTLHENGMTLNKISIILHGAGSNAGKAFKDLYNLWFDVKGHKKERLKHFIENKNKRKCFTILDLSTILSGTGVKVKDAFEKLHNVCFDNKGKRTRILNDFYNADFEPSNLSRILCGTGVHASSTLKRLHSVCFDDEGQRTELLDNLCDTGFTPTDLCNILSGSDESLNQLHDFGFTKETKMYLNNYIYKKKGSSIRNLSEIYPVLNDFHESLDERRNTTQLLMNLLDADFKLNSGSQDKNIEEHEVNVQLRNCSSQKRKVKEIDCLQQEHNIKKKRRK